MKQYSVTLDLVYNIVHFKDGYCDHYSAPRTLDLATPEPLQQELQKKLRTLKNKPCRVLIIRAALFYSLAKQKGVEVFTMLLYDIL